MPLPTNFIDSSIITDEQNYNIEELTHIIETGIPQLNTEQHTVYDKVIAAVNNQTPAVFFIDAEFAKWLLKISKGCFPAITSEPDIIKLSEDIILQS
ncbi:19138_t:CDS:2 [Cetraspora pellucida]|uniref:19138_t:CDS:1 n=1 Tax=Cetraspora pellucida TaxID=1433469 RepID=A0A9N9BGY8_9GLOM|nr:19138_t:CDS:2 [Cetraspora pellucida]